MYVLIKNIVKKTRFLYHLNAVSIKHHEYIPKAFISKL
jgi:hypothetical protein